MQLECFVSYAHTPNEFYIQLVVIIVVFMLVKLLWKLQLNSKLEQLMVELQEYAVESRPLTVSLLPGILCLAQFSLDQLWYRAIVTGENGYYGNICVMMVVMVTRCRW